MRGQKKREEGVRSMPVHFGIRLPRREGGHRLTRENYVCTTRDGRYYFEDGWLRAQPELWDEHRRAVLRNFDRSMAYFDSLSPRAFLRAVDGLADAFPELVAVEDLGDWSGVAGVYVLVLDRYRQLYVGKTTAPGGIRQRIVVHWQKKVAFDRLLSGGEDRSIMAIDSFRALDTTRIFAAACREPGELEERIRQAIPEPFCANRTRAGDLAGGLAEAIAERRERDLAGFAPSPMELG